MSREIFILVCLPWLEMKRFVLVELLDDFVTVSGWSEVFEVKFDVKRYRSYSALIDSADLIVLLYD